MQCPNCQMNIKDGSKFCIHCGSQFSVVSTPQVPNAAGFCPNCNAAIQEGAQFCTNCGSQINSGQAQSQAPQPMQTQPNQTLVATTPAQMQAEKDEFDKYMRAYFGSSYDRVMQSNFSIGTFLFGWVWLLAYKLYGAAGKMFLMQLGVSFVAGIISRLLGGLGIISTAADIYVAYLFATSFSSSYKERANHEIRDILASTTDEAERLRLCQKAGGPSIVTIIIALLIFGGFIYLIIALIFGSVYRTVDNSRKDTFADTSKVYVNAIKNTVAADELKCGDVISKVESGVYYYSFTTESGTSATKLVDQGGRSPWKNGNVAGEIVIIKEIDSSTGITRYHYGIVLVDEKGRGIGEFNSDGSPRKVYKEDSVSRLYIKEQDGDNRLTYYNKAKVGTKEALNGDVAPNSETYLDYEQIEYKMRSLNKKQEKPIPCEIVE